MCFVGQGPNNETFASWCAFGLGRIAERLTAGGPVERQVLKVGEASNERERHERGAVDERADLGSGHFITRTCQNQSEIAVGFQISEAGT